MSDDTKDHKSEPKTNESLNLASLTQPDVANKTAAEMERGGKTALADCKLTEDEMKTVADLAKNKEAKDLMMKCPVAGKHLASLDQKDKDKKNA